MKMDPQPAGRDPGELPSGAPDVAAIDVAAEEAAVNGVNDYVMITRSEANLLRWMEYLPEDCIARMIAMKWDITT